MLKIFDTYVKIGEKLIKWKVVCQPDKKMNINKKVNLKCYKELASNDLKIITFIIGKNDFINRF